MQDFEYALEFYTVHPDWLKFSTFYQSVFGVSESDRILAWKIITVDRLRR